MTALTVTTELRGVFGTALINFHNSISDMESRIKSRLFIRIIALEELRQSINELITVLQTGTEQIDDDMQSIVKRAIMHHRLQIQEELELRSELTHNPALLAELELRIVPINHAVAEPWFVATTAIATPRLTDFLNLEQAEEITKSSGGLTSQEFRAFDEKFHILQAPNLLIPDMKFYRHMCESRSKQFVVAFLDIDNFKSFNDQYGHETVDEEILPPFMRALEGYVYSHGFAYRFGGDEYKLLLPNIDEGNSVSFLAGLQDSLASVSYVPIEEPINNPQISIGICEMELDCVFTDKEVIEFSERAAMHAKTVGRNCICAAHFSGTTNPTFEVVWPVHHQTDL